MKVIKILAGIIVFPLLMSSGIVLCLIGLLKSEHRNECKNWLMGS